ncbi:MAG: phytanoyl-CoA dioxygenase family protein [bacterium]|nr:phytanoyl-CoA dioxygenase family protein [bacterium]
MPTPGERFFYRTNGYLVVPDIFSPDECRYILGVFEGYRESDDYAGLMNLHRTDERVRALVRNSTIVDYLEYLQEGEVVCLQSMFLFKEAGTRFGYQAWNPHQDNAYPASPYGMYITGNFNFVDHDPGNGGMYIYPGSHVEPLLPYEAARSFHEGEGEQPGHKVVPPPQYHKLDLYMPQGSVLFLHGNAIHGSRSNTHPTRSRPMLLVPYITKGAPYKTGKEAKREPMSLRD